MSPSNPAVTLGQAAASEALSPAPRPPADTPAKIEDAAQQFEALLLAQILRSAHPGSGWLNSESDSSGDSLADYTEQQLAAVMARSGGLGLSRMIAEGLKRQSGAD
jgi:Rod binding domain-containing protein